MSPSGSSADYLDLDLRFYRSVYEGMTAELRLPWGEVVTQRLDPPPLDDLREAPKNSSEPLLYYGSLLSDWIFQGRLRERYLEARARLQGRAREVRLRVGFGIQSEVLWPLRWECLYDRPTGEFLALAGGGIQRYLADSPPGWPEAERPLRVLTVTVAGGDFSPELAGRFASAVRTAGQQHREGQGAHIIHRHAACAKLEELEEAANAAGPVHGLAVCCPVVVGSALTVNFGTRAVLWEEVARAFLGGARVPPGLVFLVSPALTVPPVLSPLDLLAPSFLKAGAAAVVSIQRDLNEDASLRFTETFFREVAVTGRIDAAVVIARRDLNQNWPGRWDWAAPVLFTLSQEARWFQPLSNSLREVLSGLETHKFSRSSSGDTW